MSKGTYRGFILAREDRHPCVKLGQYTAQAPHIDCHVIVHSENDLWRAIKSTLDIGIHLFILETAAAKVNDLNSALCWMFKQDVLSLECQLEGECLTSHARVKGTYFWLQVAVHHSVMPKKR
jgi:hypothetical protein